MARHATMITTRLCNHKGTVLISNPQQPCPCENEELLIDGILYTLTSAGHRSVQGRRRDLTNISTCACSCCSTIGSFYEDRQILQHLAERNKRLILEDFKTFDCVVELSKHPEKLSSMKSYAERFIIGYRVIAIDRSECWKYINHSIECKGKDCECKLVTCADRFCRCDCRYCSRLPRSVTGFDRKVYRLWLYYAKKLYLFMKAATSQQVRSSLQTIDPWSLRERLVCPDCEGYYVVHVYNNRSYSDKDEFHVCLVCMSMFTMAIMRPGITLQEETILTRFGVYDLC